MVARVHRIPRRLCLIGMGAALGAATRAPITAVVILFELTGEYSIILPLMAAVAMAAGTGRLLSRITIYTAKLWRRGIDLDSDDPRPPIVHRRRHRRSRTATTAQRHRTRLSRKLSQRFGSELRAMR